MSDEKVQLLLQAVGDAPSLKQKRLFVKASHNIAYLTSTLSKLLGLTPDKSLFFYVSQTFAPSPDHTFQVLSDCYALSNEDGSGKHLVLHYSISQAWG